MDTAKQYMAQIRESNGVARVAHFYSLLDVLARSSDQRLLSSTRIELPINNDLQKKIDLVISYVMKNYQEKISLPQVATIIGMSEGHFSRFFRKATGNRFIDFVNRIRIAKACEFLSRTDMAITLICSEVGFNNIANFNRRFSQHKQMTPSEYRQQARQRYYPQIH